ncbi:MAG: hypothetical protein H6Q33_4930 [Deltaproteobacteria bacterium]|jgi:hypothetical protein|nr:hypothetical protein [Deltaproteobacteria bacterium]
MRPIASVIGAVRRSLKLKLILFVITILGLTVGFTPWAAIRVQRFQLLEESERHVRSIEECAGGRRHATPPRATAGWRRGTAIHPASILTFPRCRKWQQGKGPQRETMRGPRADRLRSVVDLVH